jgi:hypothetical protein
VTGRKHFLEASITDGAGVMLTRAEALFIGTDKLANDERL